VAKSISHVRTRPVHTLFVSPVAHSSLNTLCERALRSPAAPMIGRPVGPRGVRTAPALLPSPTRRHHRQRSRSQFHVPWALFLPHSVGSDSSTRLIQPQLICPVVFRMVSELGQLDLQFRSRSIFQFVIDILVIFCCFPFSSSSGITRIGENW
jgi:hypothetical protein